MIILIDAGNTNVKLATVSNRGQITSVSHSEFYQNISDVKEVIYAAVATSSTLVEIFASCKKHKIPTKKVTVTQSFKNIKCGYKVVENLGVDRWLAVIGARLSYQDEILLIVDAGTAITLDVCSENHHLGGWIAPGLSLMQSSIVEKAPGVFIDSDINAEVFGTNTPSALFHGCVNSLAGMIERAQKSVVLVNDTDEKAAKIILTGGDASLINKYLALPSEVNKDLVFIGLKQFIE